MTIAAGFVNDSGVLMCADTLVGDGQQSSYRSKIIGSLFQDGAALFSYAGDMVFSESAIQRCVTGLQKYNGKRRDVAGIIDSIRKIWAAAYREAFGHATTYNQIIIAMFSKGEADLGLYYSSNHVLARSTTDFEVIGCGDLMFKCLVGDPPWCGRGVPIQRVFDTSVRACAHVKAAMPTAIGGNFIVANLGRDGELKLYSKREIDWVEQYTLKLDEIYRLLATAFTNFSDNSVFPEMLTSLNDAIQALRERWKAERAQYSDDHFGFYPLEASELWNAFRSIRAVQATRKAPKRGR